MKTEEKVGDLDGYGIDAPINPRQLQIKHLRACN